MYVPSVPKEEVVLEMTGITRPANFAAAQNHGVIAGPRPSGVDMYNSLVSVRLDLQKFVIKLLIFVLSIYATLWICFRYVLMVWLECVM